jgi:RNA polymerase sigma-70 factor (ECF subfamily)
MAHNLAIDSIRKQKQSSALEDADSLPDYSADSISQKIDIEEALLSLSERDLRILTLHINGELKFREIASIMEIPLGTVLWAYQKSIKQLQRILGGAL